MNLSVRQATGSMNRSFQPLNAKQTVVHAVGRELKGGDVAIESFNVPNRIAPGGIIDIEATVANDSLVTTPFDPDYCASADQLAGYQYEIEINPDWTQAETNSGCLLQATVSGGTARDDFRWEFDGPPSAGNWSVEMTLRFPGSGESTTVTRQILVEDSADTRPGPEPPGPDLPGGGGGVTALAFGGVVLFLIVAILYGLSRNDAPGPTVGTLRNVRRNR